MRNMARLVVVTLALSLVGCVQRTTVIKVKPDGTGTVEVTSTMNSAAITLLRQHQKEMAAAMGDAKKAEQAGEVFSEAEAKAEANKMGEGVTFVKAESVKTAKVEGYKAIYAFTDINKLKLSTTPQGGEGHFKLSVEGQVRLDLSGKLLSGEAHTPDMKAEPEESGESVTFKMTRQANDNGLLTALFHKKADPAQKTEEASDDPTEAQQMMFPAEWNGQVNEMLKGSRISIQVEPSTMVVSTNAPSREGNLVTLMSLDLDEIMKDEANFKRFTAAKDMSPLERAKQMKGVAGATIPATEEVTIEFRPK